MAHQAIDAKLGKLSKGRSEMVCIDFETHSVIVDSKGVHSRQNTEIKWVSRYLSFNARTSEISQLSQRPRFDRPTLPNNAHTVA